VAWISTQDKKSGPRYRVFWKDSEGKQHGKVFRKYEKAKTFKREIEHSLEVRGGAAGGGDQGLGEGPRVA
jgi:hypothetical protein